VACFVNRSGLKMDGEETELLFALVVLQQRFKALAGNPYSHVGSTNFCLFRQGSLRNPIKLRVELSGVQWLVS
jgi:hypothetical protein